MGAIPLLTSSRVFCWTRKEPKKGLLDSVDEMVGQCEARQALGEAPRLPAAGASTASSFNGKIQVGPLFLGDVIALHVLGAASMYSPRVRVHSKDPLES